MKFSAVFVAIVTMAAAAIAAPVPEAAVTANCGFNRNACEYLRSGDMASSQADGRLTLLGAWKKDEVVA
jgi:hypothetical protein